MPRMDRAELETLVRRIEDLEARVAALDGRSRWDPAAGIANDPEMHDLLRRGRTIEAIKLYRERTGVGLAEAKAAVDRMVGPGLP